MSRTLLWPLLAAVLCSPAPLDAAPIRDARVQALIHQLGSRSWSRRETASRRLAELGERAHAALKQASRSTDLEIRRRVRQLLAPPAPPEPTPQEQRIEALRRAIEQLARDAARRPHLGGLRILNPPPIRIPHVRIIPHPRIQATPPPIRPRVIDWGIDGTDRKALKALLEQARGTIERRQGTR